MGKYIKQIEIGAYRPIVLSLIAAVAYLFVPILGWVDRDTSLLLCLIFLLVAVVLFLAALCDVLKSVIDSTPTPFTPNK